MKPLIIAVAFPSTLALGALSGLFSSVQTFVVALAISLLLWASACLLCGVPLGSVLLTSLGLGVAAEIGYAFSLLYRARIARQQRAKRVSRK